MAVEMNVQERRKGLSRAYGVGSATLKVGGLKKEESSNCGSVTIRVDFKTKHYA